MAPHTNLYTSKVEYDPTDPPGYRGGMLHLTKAEGGSELAVKLFDLPPGETLCPFHYEFVEEWLLALRPNSTFARRTAPSGWRREPQCASRRSARRT